MTTLHPGLAGLAHDAALGWQALPDGRVEVSDGEVRLRVVRDGDSLVVERVSRGAPPGTALRTSELSAVERYLVAWIGDAWRDHHRLPRVVADATTVSDATVVQGDGWGATLTWTQDGRTCVATELTVGAAHRLAALLAHDVDTLIASYRDPAGRPGPR